MSLAIVHSRALVGMAAPPVDIEVHLSRGLPGLSIVGLPEKAVRESKDRVRSALLNCGFSFPAKRIIVNLAPADLPKNGCRFDLPIALGILAASEQVPKTSVESYDIAGELELSGTLRSVQGMLPFAMASRQAGRPLIVPRSNAKESALISALHIYSANHLLEVCAHLRSEKVLTRIGHLSSMRQGSQYPDMQDVLGQQQARRALEIAAAGEHSLLFVGSPGTGKTMLSSRLPGILPPLSEEEALEAAAVYSISRQGFDSTKWGQRPFRAPHHTASSVALIGGGSPPQPGEVSLAHRGVLFLDELPEFQRPVLESLREPLEAGHVTVSRASYQSQFPARFQLVAAMNPCPCGYLMESSARCRCTSEQVSRYQARISGPLLDRIDLHVQVPPLPNAVLLSGGHCQPESTETVRARVLTARSQQWERSKKSNQQLTTQEIKVHCCLSPKDQIFFEHAMQQLNVSARGYHRLLRVARTIADLAGDTQIRQVHLQEAFIFRGLQC